MKTRIAQLLLVVIKHLMKSELGVKHMDGGHLEARLYFVPHTTTAPANNKEQLN